tara:strand:+ start:1877 stop:2581 length:705 start_codon:yes stop_codon:yes gene_type:complete
MNRIISIAGGSGVGKTTISQLLIEAIGQENAVMIHGDDSHKWERGEENWQQYTHLDPSANNLEREFDHLSELKSNNNISRSHYDHDTGKFTDPLNIDAKPFIIYDGLHALYNANMRFVSDLKIFVKASEPLRTYWKVNRDTEKRGATKESVLDHCARRRNDYEQFIAPQENEADIVIFFELQHTIDTDYPMEDDDMSFCLSIKTNQEDIIYNCNLDEFKDIINNTVLKQLEREI